MDKLTAQRLVRNTLKAPFDRKRYYGLVNELCNGFDDGKAIDNMSVPEAFAAHVKSCQRLGTFTSPEGELADVLVVKLTESWKLERSRTALRDFVAHKLKRDNAYKEAGLIAFVAPDSQSWRFSYVRMDYETKRDSETGKIKSEERLTPARRYSYLVGAEEECHTAQTRFLALLQNTAAKPTLAQIEEAFSVESVTKEFFNEYARLFKATDEALTAVRADLAAKGVSTVDFAKKLLGQIVFLYFIQKKGWLGVGQGQSWGEGPRHFLRQLANQAVAQGQCLFNKVLEPLFYDTLATDRGAEAWCPVFKCRIPFLNGGLFEPLAGYDWEQQAIVLPNALFTNQNRTASGDIGTGILDVFDRYNFTVNEAEPLEKEVAIDPEMLGKVFENLIEENRRKGLGAFYTPREIVHYMCQESLINYLDTTVNAEIPPGPPLSKGGIQRADIEALIREGEQAAHYETARKDGTVSYQRRLPKAIEENARPLDEALRNITVCDPAIGSGAFPVGMMTEIVRVRMALTPYFDQKTPSPLVGEGGGGGSERTAYYFKRHAIQNSLYGVDIDIGAVEIAKLRLWLSLVVDEEDVKQIKPLPNLDYKVVAGNSLLGVEKNLFNEEYFKQLEVLKPKFFNESDRAKKAQFKQQIDKLIHQLTKGLEVFDFEIYFSEVFHQKGGFDVVIGNPPYALVEKESFMKIYGRKFTLLSGKPDLYRAFIERGLNLPHSLGVMCFIVPNTLLAIPSAQKLREFITRERTICLLIDLTVPAFEEAAVNNIIFLFKMQIPNGNEVSVGIMASNGIIGLCDKLQKIQQDEWEKNGKCEWLIYVSGVVRDVIEKIEANSISLGKIIGDITLGIQVYHNTLHTKDQMNARYLHSDSNRGKNWLPEYSGRHLENFVVNRTKEVPFVNYSASAIYKKPEMRFFQSPRLILREIIGERLVVAFADATFAVNKSCYILRSENATDADLKAWLAILNSKCVSFWVKLCGDKAKQALFPRVTMNTLKTIPIAKEWKNQKQKLSGLVDRILAEKKQDAKADTTALEREIDQLVYALYGLTRDEIAVIEGAEEIK